MRRLHLVGFTSELDGLIFSASDNDRSGGYVVELDDEVLAAVREVLARRDVRRTGPVGAGRGIDPAAGPGGRAGSALAPREIQARLRAGRSVSEVALEAGVDDEWVRRFAAPVLAEQTHVIQRALETVVDEGDGPPSSASLHESVLISLAGRGMVVTDHELSSAWNAFHVRDSSWVVQLRAAIGHDEVLARWGFDTRSGTLVALDATAADLGWLDAFGRGRAAVEAAARHRNPDPVPPANGGTASPPGTAGAAEARATAARRPGRATGVARDTEPNAPARGPGATDVAATARRARAPRTTVVAAPPPLAERPEVAQEALPLRVATRPAPARRRPTTER